MARLDFVPLPSWRTGFKFCTLFCVQAWICGQLHLLVHVFPSPSNPGLHWHRYEPSVLSHVAFGEHGGDGDVSHSLTSVKEIRMQPVSNSSRTRETHVQPFYLWLPISDYSETQLLRTIKGNEKMYVLTKVRSIQNAIFLTGRTGSTCSRERSDTEDASSSWMSFITCFSNCEIAFQGIVNLKTCWQIEIETERQWMTCSWSEKKNQRKGKKVLL